MEGKKGSLQSLHLKKRNIYYNSAPFLLKQTKNNIKFSKLGIERDFLNLTFIRNI